MSGANLNANVFKLFPRRKSLRKYLSCSKLLSCSLPVRQRYMGSLDPREAHALSGQHHLAESGRLHLSDAGAGGGMMQQRMLHPGGVNLNGLPLSGAGQFDMGLPLNGAGHFAYGGLPMHGWGGAPGQVGLSPTPCALDLSPAPLNPAP